MADEKVSKKRGAERQLTKDDDPDALGPEEANGTWQRASDDEIKGRRIVKARGVKKSSSDVTPPVPTPAAGAWPTFNFGGTSSAEKKGEEEPSKEGFKFEALSSPIEPAPLPPIPKFDFKFEFGSSDKDKEKKSEGSSALQPATFAFEYKPIEFNFNFDKKEEPTAFEQKEELGEKRDYAGIIKATQDQTKVLGENVAPPSEPVMTSVLATSQETGGEDAPEPVEPTPEPLKSGEEDEQVIVSRDAKAYEFVEGQWRERGVGQLRVLKPLAASENSDEASKGRTRVVMRQQKTGRLLINSFVWSSMPLSKKDKALYLSAIATTPVPAMFCARFKTLDDCTAVFDEMQRAKDQAPADGEDKKSTAASTTAASENKSEGASATNKPESENNKSDENGDGQDGEVEVV